MLPELSKKSGSIHDNESLYIFSCRLIFVFIVQWQNHASTSSIINYSKDYVNLLPTTVDVAQNQCESTIRREKYEKVRWRVLTLWVETIQSFCCLLLERKESIAQIVLDFVLSKFSKVKCEFKIKGNFTLNEWKFTWSDDKNISIQNRKNDWSTQTFTVNSDSRRVWCFSSLEWISCC